MVDKSVDEEEVQLKLELKELKAQELAKRKRLREESEDLKVKKPLHNCAIYVSNLPLGSTTKDAVVKEFSKYGIIQKDAKTNEPRCKLYTDEQGSFKGSALVVYMRRESVDLAIDLMNGYRFLGNELKVEEATFKKDIRDSNDKNQRPDTGESNADHAPEEKRARLSEMEETNAQDDNSLDDEGSLETTSANSKENLDRDSRTVILANVLDLYATLNAQQIAEIADDIKEGCESIGPTTRFALDEVLGQATVEYETKELAHLCTQRMSGRYFDGRKLLAYTLDQETNEDEDDLSV